jgi:hypothetical protein
MNIEQFWSLNESLPPENAAETLKQRLMKLEPTEIEDYQAHFDRAFASAYQWLLWAAAYIIEGGCSDDGFIDFRYGLISRGRSIFEASLANPDSLADVASDDDDGFIPNEEFGYVAQRVYEKKVGSRIPENNVSHPAEPVGESWDFEDDKLCEENLPRIWSKFGA